MVGTKRAPIAPIPLEEVDVARLWAHIDCFDHDPDACWYWIGPGIRWLGEAGQFVVAKRGHPAYRVVYAVVNSDPGPDRDVHHTCRNRGCCRPLHLVALTLVEHRVCHNAGVNTALIRAFGAELPSWSLLAILDLELLSRAGLA